MMHFLIGDKIDLLLVEDEEFDAMLFQDAILTCREQSPKIKIAVCSSIKQARDALENQAFDLILLDINLPDAVELEGFKQLIMLFPEIPIVIHSGVYSSKLACEAIALGAQDYIVKGTMSKEDLVRTLVHAKMRHEVHKRLRLCLTEV